MFIVKMACAQFNIGNIIYITVCFVLNYLKIVPILHLSNIDMKLLNT